MVVFLTRDVFMISLRDSSPLLHVALKFQTNSFQIMQAKKNIYYKYQLFFHYTNKVLT